MLLEPKALTGYINVHGSRNKEAYQSSMTEHRKVKWNVLRKLVKNVPSRSPLFEGGENRPL